MVVPIVVPPVLLIQVMPPPKAPPEEGKARLALFLNRVRRAAEVKEQKDTAAEKKESEKATDAAPSLPDCDHRRGDESITSKTSEADDRAEESPLPAAAIAATARDSSDESAPPDEVGVSRGIWGDKCLCES